MRFNVNHRTGYAYSEPVWLAPHVLRLQPRCGSSGRIVAHQIEIDPPPAGRSPVLDCEGNSVLRVWFDGPTHHLVVTSRFEIETVAHGHDLPDPTPQDHPYPASLRSRLAPWIDVEDGGGSVVFGVSQEIGAAAADVADFVTRLNRHLFECIEREIRESGAPQPPEHTLATGRGACRDLALLFCAICRRRGLAARFVSGYQKGRETDKAPARRWMHAWPEVYLPGDGWRGFDPTHGEAVADAHVALAAAARPEDAAPIEGSYYGAARSTLTTELTIDVDP